MTLTEVHAVLQQAFHDVLSLHGELDSDVSPDTAFAIGNALGVIEKAKALVGRDIDQARAIEAKPNIKRWELRNDGPSDPNAGSDLVPTKRDD